jgi:hypothetical protein
MSDDERSLPHLQSPPLCPKKKIYFENLKKKSYQSRRNLLQPQIVKNLSPKWSVFVRIFYKNNSIFFFLYRYLLILRMLLILLTHIF